MASVASAGCEAATSSDLAGESSAPDSIAPSLALNISIVPLQPASDSAAAINKTRGKRRNIEALPHRLDGRIVESLRDFS
jgi:hypothetical protein